ncbi:MAG: hypothetical protein V3V12_00855 [Gammaproteobacteria bacterium]
MSTLQLTIPTQLEDASDAGKAKPREVAQWLENLPFLDLQRTAPAIHQQLKLFNRMAISPTHRLQILDAFRQAYTRLRTSTSKTNQALNISLETLCKKLCQDLAFGYKIAINDLLNKKLAIGQKKQLAQAIGGALDCLSHHVTYFFADYYQTPRALWAEAVLLFRFAQEKGIEQQSLNTIDNESATLQQIFTGMALLQLSDPYQLQPGVVWKLRSYLDHHSDKVPLFDSSALDLSNQPKLIIDNNDDIKTHILLAGISKITEQIHQDLDLLAQPKKPVIAGFANDTGTYHISHTLKRVLASWDRLIEQKSSQTALLERSNRKTERKPVHQHLELAASVNSIWYMLNNQRAFDPQLYDQKHDHEIDLGNIQDDNIERQAAEHKIATCSSINRSNGGVALHVELEEGMSLHVGQLVALHRPDASSGSAAWIVATCRWLMERRANNVDIGLQYLARNARPIAIRSRISGVSRVGVMPAFAVTQNHHEALITSAGIFRPNALLDIYEQGRKQSVRCDQLLEASFGFERFTYQKVESD